MRFPYNIAPMKIFVHFVENINDVTKVYLGMG